MKGIERSQSRLSDEFFRTVHDRRTDHNEIPLKTIVSHLLDDRCECTICQNA